MSQNCAENNLAGSSNWQMPKAERALHPCLYMKQGCVWVCTSACLNLRFGHLRWTLMPCQMDKIRENVCEERPAAPEQLLDWDINNRLKWRGTGRRGNGPKTIGRQERVQEWNLGSVAGRRSCRVRSASIIAISVRQVRRMPNPPRLPIFRSPSSSFFFFLHQDDLNATAEWKTCDLNGRFLAGTKPGCHIPEPYWSDGVEWSLFWISSSHQVDFCHPAIYVLH